MKILQLIQKPQLRGAEIFACQLSEELYKKGVEVDILYLFPNDGFTLDFNVSFISLDGSPKKRFWDFKAYRKLSEIIKQGNYNIVQANAGDTLKYSVLSKVIFRWNATLVFRNANRMTGFIRNGIQALYNKWLLRGCNSFISVSENSRQDLISFFPPAKNCSRTIPVGTYATNKINPLRRDIPQREPIFISIGSLVPEKNHFFLLEVFHLYYKETGIGFLWLVGDGRLRGALEQQVTILGIQERVKFWSYRKDVISILKSADIFVMPSLIEGLPAVILEAMACEIPVVASSVGGIPEVVEDDVTGVCINQWIAKVYVERIIRLLNDQVYRRRLVQQAKERFHQRFTMEKICDDFLAYYQTLTTQRTE